VSHTQTYQACIFWQAQAIDGQYWQIVTHKGECFATVSQPITQNNMTAQQAAQLMADAPALLKELLVAHGLLRDIITRLPIEDMQPTTERYKERLKLLAKYRDLIEDRDADYQDLIANKERGRE
jgi:hypothetical protein